MRPPPGYPFEGDIPSVPPPAMPKDAPIGPGPLAFVIAFAGAMMGAGFMLVALVATEARHAQPPPPEPPHITVAVTDDTELKGVDSEGHPTDSPSAPPSAGASPSPSMPSVDRKIPVFPARFLEGCSSADLETIEHHLYLAIGKGAPLYNDGDILGCAELYENSAREIEGSLPASCSGPIHALADGRAAATKVGSPAGRAWAMRNAFDGVIDSMDRSRTGGVPSL